MLQNNISCSLLCSPQKTRCCTRQPGWNSGSEGWKLGEGEGLLRVKCSDMHAVSSGDLLHSGQPTALCCTAKDSKHGRVRGQLARAGCLLSCGFWCRALACWATHQLRSNTAAHLLCECERQGPVTAHLWIWGGRRDWPWFMVCLC